MPVGFIVNYYFDVKASI